MRGNDGFQKIEFFKKEFNSNMLKKHLQYIIFYETHNHLPTEKNLFSVFFGLNLFSCENPDTFTKW